MKFYIHAGRYNLDDVINTGNVKPESLCSISVAEEYIEMNVHKWNNKVTCKLCRRLMK